MSKSTQVSPSLTKGNSIEGIDFRFLGGKFKIPNEQKSTLIRLKISKS